MGKSILKKKLTAFNYFELGINEKYAVSGGELRNIQKWLNRKSLSATFLYNNQSEYLISIRAYPFWMERFFDGIGSYAKFPIGPFKPDEVNCLGKKLSGQKSPVLIGEYNVPRKYNNFMDYAPYTRITAYIPYLSFVELPVNEIMGKTIKFYAQMDFDNGLMSVWLEVNDTVIQTWEVSIGVEVNLSRTNGTDWARNMYLWGIKTLTGTGGLMIGGATSEKGVDYGKSVKTGGDIGIGFIGANQHHVFRGNVATGNTKLYSPTSIYLIFEREVPTFENVETNNGENTYASIYGLPLMRTMNIASLRGLTIINEIHLENLNNALESEKDMIINLLRTGVIL